MYTNHIAKRPGSKKQNMFMTQQVAIVHLAKNGKEALTKYTSSKLVSDYQAYCKVRNSLRSLTRNLQKNYIRMTSRSTAKSNPKLFWCYTCSLIPS